MDRPEDRLRLAPPPPDRRRAGGGATAPEVDAALALSEQTASLLQSAPSFRRLGLAQQARILRDLDSITRHLRAGAPTAAALATPLDRRRRAFAGSVPQAESEEPAATDDHVQPGPRRAATQDLAQRAGALSDEIDFPAFVASLVHGTFDAIVDASIRQMEAFADLVGSIAKGVEEFTRDNVSANQARDWLVQQYPRDLVLDLADGPRVLPRPDAEADADEPRSPAWLADFGLADEELTAELIEEELVPRARGRVGQNRLQTLATMVLLGMNRVVVKDGTISTKLKFRAVAADHARIDYAMGDDPSSGSQWGQRGSHAYAAPTTKVSTLGVNVQSDTDLKVDLFGEVKINFASETLPLDRFVDEARRTLLERHARPPLPPRAPRGSAAEPAEPAPPPPETTR